MNRALVVMGHENSKTHILFPIHLDLFLLLPLLHFRLSVLVYCGSLNTVYRCRCCRWRDVVYFHFFRWLGRARDDFCTGTPLENFPAITDIKWGCRMGMGVKCESSLNGSIRKAAWLCLANAFQAACDVTGCYAPIAANCS
jgi:hypothetical protein